MVEAKKVTKKVVKAPAEKKVVIKVTPKKAVAKSVKAPKTEAAEATIKVEKGSLTVIVYDVKGKEAGKMELPKEVFGAKINPVLMAQAVRVYLANQRIGSAHTKTRGEVDGSTRKIYRQKGTGRARHGGIRAPIFVGGGIAHGPRTKEFELSLSKKMKKAAVISALSSLAQNGQIKVISGWEKLEAKTKIAASAFDGMGLTDKKALLVMPKHLENVFKAARNIEKVKVTAAALLTTYDVLNAGTLILMKETVDALTKGKDEKEGNK